MSVAPMDADDLHRRAVTAERGTFFVMQDAIFRKEYDDYWKFVEGSNEQKMIMLSDFGVAVYSRDGVGWMY